MTGTISETSGLINGATKSYTSPGQTASSSKTVASVSAAVQKNADLISSGKVRESIAQLNRENLIRTGKSTDISKNDRTGDIVVKFFDLEGNKIFQKPPEQYLKIKELNNISGSFIDIII